MASSNRSPTPTHSEDSHGKTSAAEHMPTKDPKDEPHLEGRITGWLTLSVLAAALGSSFVFGYNIGCINVAGAKIQRWIAESQDFAVNASLTATDKEYLDSLSAEDSNRLTLIWSLVGGLFPLGAMFGGLSVGFVADKFGRKTSMLVNNILTLIAGLTMMATRVSGTYVTLLVGRLIIGVNCGLNSGLAPMYLTEISPINYRGLLGSVNQLMVTISILVANIVGMEFFLGRDCCWPYVLGFTMLPAVWQVIALPMCPESPKYLLIMKGDGDQARQALKKLRQSENVDAEMNAMQEEANKMKSAPRVTLGEMFKTPVLRWAITLAIMLMLSQQLSGINATMFYSSSIFEKDAKLGPALATYATIGVMVVNVLMTVVSTAIVDKCGRRLLLLISLAGMFVTTICLVVTLYLSGQENAMAPYFSILFVVLFVVAFATGCGSIPWFYVSECFEQGARGLANSIAVGTNWFATFLIGCSFPPVQRALKEYTFLIFTVCLLFFMIFFHVYLPETKGKSIDQVTAELQKAVGETKESSLDKKSAKKA